MTEMLPFPYMFLLPCEVNEFFLISKNNRSYQMGVLFEIYHWRPTH